MPLGLAGILTASFLGASLGTFQSADILQKDRNVLGMAGQVEIREGDLDVLTFPTAEAWYRLGLGFGDFGVKLAADTLRGSLKLPISVDPDPVRLAVEPAVSVGEYLYDSGAVRVNTFTQGAEVSLLASYGDISISPRAAFTYSKSDRSGTGTNDTRYREWRLGGTLTRGIKGERVDWWGELGAYRVIRSISGMEPKRNESYFLFAPGIGASIEF